MRTSNTSFFLCSTRKLIIEQCTPPECNFCHVIATLFVSDCHLLSSFEWFKNKMYSYYLWRSRGENYLQLANSRKLCYVTNNFENEIQIFISASGPGMQPVLFHSILGRAILFCRQKGYLWQMEAHQMWLGVPFYQFSCAT